MAAHATILNEYGWLWLRRDGEPTVLTEKLYPKLLGPGVDEGRAARAERLPSRRQDRVLARPPQLRRRSSTSCTSTCSYPGVFTADHFADVKALKLNPWFEDYMAEAMKPLGVYLNFFQPDARGRGRAAPTA